MKNRSGKEVGTAGNGNTKKNWLWSKENSVVGHITGNRLV